jgi:carbonic anhydrase
MIDFALERNRAFAAAGGHEGAVVFPNLRLFVITCLDPRVDPAHVLGLGLSDAMVLRNVGGRVTPEVINDVAFIARLAESALPDGPLFDGSECPGTSMTSSPAWWKRFFRRPPPPDRRLGATNDRAISGPRAIATATPHAEGDERTVGCPEAGGEPCAARARTSRQRRSSPAGRAVQFPRSRGGPSGSRADETIRPPRVAPGPR